MVEVYQEQKTSGLEIQIRELQRILNEKGFDAGPADGVLGAKTHQAVRDFQTSEGLAATGNPDDETLKALAPDAETQELFGLSPEFGEKEMEQKQPQEPMGTPEPQETETPEGTKPIERY